MKLRRELRNALIRHAASQYAFGGAGMWTIAKRLSKGIEIFEDHYGYLLLDKPHESFTQAQTSLFYAYQFRELPKTARQIYRIISNTDIEPGLMSQPV